jgi:hypothetical protein
MGGELGKVNLRNVNPQGRVDVLLYKLLERFAPTVEQQVGLRGIWNVVEPQVHELITEHITPIEIPSELKMFLAILQANYPGGENADTANSH